jgi:long-chain acyl-CoA synthetase
MNADRLILDHVYDHEAQHADRVYLTQPLGGGRVQDYTWAQALDQARRMAAYLKAQGFEPGARIAILSKNCAHFILAELAIWMSGGTTVAIFPTEKAETVRFVLEHSGASLLFVGKLDTWEEQRAGVPAGLPCIAFPLAPAPALGGVMPTWDEIVAHTAPMPGRPARGADELAMILYTSGSTGTPKGVMTSFGAITRTGRGIAEDTRRRIGSGDSRMLSYLPLAHSFERSWVEASSLIDGGTHLFFAESLDTFLADLQRARPTLFISVPRLWLKFQQGVFAKMPPAKLDRLLSDPHPRRHRAQEGAQGPGPGCRGAGRQRLGTLAGGPDPLVPQARPAPVRGLRHERGQLLLAQFQRGPWRAGLGRRADGQGRGGAGSARRARS